MTQEQGWYPDPLNPSRNIYWDGSQWHDAAPSPPSAPPSPAAPAPQTGGAVNTSKFPVGAVVTIAGAAVLALAVFLPFSEPAGLIRVVYSNTMMQHGGWELLALAAIIAFAAFWAASRPAQWWRPLIGAVLALAEMGFIFFNQDNRTLYPMGSTTWDTP